jgi:hypothetical protein
MLSQLLYVVGICRSANNNAFIASEHPHVKQSATQTSCQMNDRLAQFLGHGHRTTIFDDRFHYASPYSFFVEAWNATLDRRRTVHASMDYVTAIPQAIVLAIRRPVRIVPNRFPLW